MRWRGYAQAFSLWPIYSVALVAALLRVEIGHIATPKVKSGDTHYRLVLPQIGLLCALVVSIFVRVGSGVGIYDLMPLAFAAFSVYVQLLAIRNAAGAQAQGT